MRVPLSHSASTTAAGFECSSGRACFICVWWIYCLIAIGISEECVVSRTSFLGESFHIYFPFWTSGPPFFNGPLPCSRHIDWCLRGLSFSTIVLGNVLLWPISTSPQWYDHISLYQIHLYTSKILQRKAIYSKVSNFIIWTQRYKIIRRKCYKSEWNKKHSLRANNSIKIKSSISVFTRLSPSWQPYIMA